MPASEKESDELADGYQLKFVGKNYAKFIAGQATETVLVPDVIHNEKQENKNSKNVFITGDNLDALKHLENAYTGKVDVIYIDPPYNTGGDDFIYRDNFKFTDEDLESKLGLTEKEISRIRALEGKSSHSAWLTFMYPRLVIAKRLLKDSGVIFISIDDNEQANLKLMCDEVFGEGNFVNTILWQRASGGGNASGIVTGHDYILVYQKQMNEIYDYRGDKITATRFNTERTKIIDGKTYYLNDDVVRKVFGKYTSGVERKCYYEELAEYKTEKAVLI